MNPASFWAAGSHTRTAPFLAIFVFCLAGPAQLMGEEQETPPQAVAKLLEQRCLRCHNGKRHEGDIRFDTASANVRDARSAEVWHEALNALQRGDMPPEGEPMPDADRRQLVAWLQGQLERVAAESRPARPTIRRLNRFEYQRTMASVLQIEHDYAANLPPDERSEDGFTNAGQALRMSDLQLEFCLQAARRGLQHAIVAGPAPEVHRHRATETVADKGRGQWTNYLGRGGMFVARVPKFPDAGEFELKVTAHVVRDADSNGETPRMRIRFGYRADTQTPSKLVGEADVDSTQPNTWTFRGRMEEFPVQSRTQSKYPGQLIWIENLFDDGKPDKRSFKKPGKPKKPKQNQKSKQKLKQQLKQKNGNANAKPTQSKPAETPPAAAAFAEPGVPTIVIDAIEFVAPVYTRWPPAHHRRLVADRTDDALRDARQSLKKFLPIAFRRDVAPAVVESYVELFAAIRSRSGSFEAALRDTYAAALISPEFLYLSTAESVDDFDIASRLSYLLWSSPPDDELLRVAREGKLRDAAVRCEQAIRMLQDSRRSGFVRQFATEWLDLDGVDRVAINPNYYPKFDPQLKYAMREETRHYFAELLEKNLNIRLFLDSDFAMWNRELAQHYGAKEDLPAGRPFERVSLGSTGGLRRGGLLSQGAILLANSTGEDSHPIKRGVWIRDRLLNDPPAPPPPNVPNLDADNVDFAKLSVKQQLEAHLENNACADCHHKIDPWGIALEQFDAVGRIRQQIRRAGQGKKFVLHPVDSQAKLPNGQQIDGVHSLQKHLRAEWGSVFAKGLAHRLLSYALGRTLTAADEPAVRAIVQRAAERGDGLADFVIEVVRSDSFVR